MQVAGAEEGVWGFVGAGALEAEEVAEVSEGEVGGSGDPQAEVGAGGASVVHLGVGVSGVEGGSLSCSGVPQKLHGQPGSCPTMSQKSIVVERFIRMIGRMLSCDDQGCALCL